MSRTRWTAAFTACAALVAMGSAIRARGAEPADAGAHLVRFTAERSCLLAGGHPTPECSTVLTAEIAPPVPGAGITFAVVPGTGRGRTAPALLSRTRAETDERGTARTFVVSSDAEEHCTVRARVWRAPAAEGARATASPGLPPDEPLEVSLEFRRTLAGVTAGVSVAAVSPQGSWPAPQHRAASVLATQLADLSVETRTAAKRTLLKLGRGAVGALVEVAADARVSPDARRLAVRTLAEMASGEADDVLLALLGHPLPDVRDGAEEAISMMSTARAQPLAEAALTSGSPSVRAAALRVLGRLRTEGASRAVETALGDADPFVRATAVWESARVGGPGAEGSLASALGDEDLFVRVSAAKAVVLLGYAGEGPGALEERLRDALADSEPALRSAAAKAVGLREWGAETALAPLGRDPDPRVRLAVALAFTWRADTRSSLRHLRALVGDEDRAVREAAFRAVAESGSEAEADIMLAMLRSGDDEARELAARALQRVTCLDFGWYGARTEAERAEIVRRWRDWWDASGGLSREDWLWQALDLPGSKLRGAAGLELARSMPIAGPALEADGKPGGPGRAVRTVSSSRPGRTAAALRRKRRRLPAALGDVVGSVLPAERHAAAEALLILGEESGLEPLEADLADARVYVRLGAARTLASALSVSLERSGPRAPSGSAGPRAETIACKVARLLVSALEDRSVAVRRSAARALEESVGQSFGYVPRAPAEHRARAVARWREWLGTPPRADAPPPGAE